MAALLERYPATSSTRVRVRPAIQRAAEKLRSSFQKQIVQKICLKMEVTTGSMLAAVSCPSQCCASGLTSHSCRQRPAVSCLTGEPTVPHSRSLVPHPPRVHGRGATTWTRRRVTPTALGRSARVILFGVCARRHPFRRGEMPAVSTAGGVVSPSGGHDPHACTDPVCSPVLRSADAVQMQYRFALVCLQQNRASSRAAKSVP